MSIRNQMKSYNFYTLEDELNDYGEHEAAQTASGTIEMAINLKTETMKDYILYSQAQYIGLTADSITDKYIIEYGNEKLKVLYVNTFGRLNQAFMERMN